MTRNSCRGGKKVADGGTVPCLLIQNGAVLIRHRLAKEENKCNKGKDGVVCC